MKEVLTMKYRTILRLMLSVLSCMPALTGDLTTERTKVTALLLMSEVERLEQTQQCTHYR